MLFLARFWQFFGCTGSMLLFVIHGGRKSRPWADKSDQGPIDINTATRSSSRGILKV